MKNNNAEVFSDVQKEFERKYDDEEPSKGETLRRERVKERKEEYQPEDEE